MIMRAFFVLMAALLPLVGVGPGQAQDLTFGSPHDARNGGFASSVAMIGDIDGDGVPEILVGSPRENEYKGAAYIVSGADGTFLLSLSSPNAKKAGYFGTTVSSMGDIDGDEVTDLLIGAPGEEGAGWLSGRAYVFSGSNGRLLHTFVSPIVTSHDRFGEAVSIGDISGDGIADVLITATSANGPAWKPDNGHLTNGRAYAFSGSDGRLLHTLTSPEPKAGGQFGRAIAPVEDVDGDGVPDFVIGAPNEGGEMPLSGRAYVFSGRNGSLLRTLTSPEPENMGTFGASIAGSGDMNGDGSPDALITQPNSESGKGRVYLVSLTDGHVVRTYRPTSTTGVRFGVDVALAGDIDGDGVSEILVGEYDTDGDDWDKGGVYLVSGADGTVLRAIMEPEPPASWFGTALAAAGDLNEDSIPDFLVGAPSAPFKHGRLYIYDGNVADALDHGISAFTGASLDSDTVLRWWTRQGSRHLGFGVQMSRGEEWHELGYVTVKDDSTAPRDYGFVVSSSATGPRRFRLRAVDASGVASYSGEFEVDALVDTGISSERGIETAGKEVRLRILGAHPVSSRAAFELTLFQAQRVNAEVLDVLGRRVGLLHGGNASGAVLMEWNASNAAPGIYFLRVVGESFVEGLSFVIAR